jgi:hypothetical protein
MMAKWALIVDGKAHEITDVDPDGRFASDMEWKPCGDNVAACWSWDGSTFVAPAAPTVDLSAYAASKRYAVETGGIDFNGKRVLTDRDSQGLITGAYSYVQKNPTTTVSFKTADGFITLSADQVTAIADAVGAHVQASFAAEAAIDAEITAGTITTTAEIDAASWPGNAD